MATLFYNEGREGRDLRVPTTFVRDASDGDRGLTSIASRQPDSARQDSPLFWASIVEQTDQKRGSARRLKMGFADQCGRAAPVDPFTLRRISNQYFMTLIKDTGDRAIV
jgi:hypothetical protein